MDTDNGFIYANRTNIRELEEMISPIKSKISDIELPETKRLHKAGRLIGMNVDLTPRQIREGRVRANDICPCGSGKKFKRCCYTG